VKFRGGPAASRPLADRVPPSSADSLRGDAVWAAALASSLILLAAMLLLARPLGSVLIPTGGVQIFPSALHEVYLKPTQEMRYLLAVIFAAGLAVLLASWHGRSTRSLDGTARAALRVAALVARFALAGFVVWVWLSQFRGLSGEFPTTHFSYGNLVVAAVLALALALFTWWRPGWLQTRSYGLSARSPWFLLAALLGGCWLLPDIYRLQNLAPALIEVTYHLEFTFDDFIAQLNGLTPLVDYNAQYASLLPFAVGPVLALTGATIGAFTVIMCGLTLLSLLAVERVFAHVSRSELLAFVLYVPFLAVSLFTVTEAGPERYNFGDYFAVFPLRYFGPYVLLWLCVRHLRGLRPRGLVPLFVVAGLVVMNNLEFGLPALLAAIAACLAASAPGAVQLWRLARSTVLGLLGAFALVSAITLLRAGELPELSRLTRYSRLFAVAGLTLLPTPIDGFQLIIFLTFAVALVVAALRFRRGAEDRTLTGALAYSGVFGLGAGAYYMGRSHPIVLIAMFSAWALSGALLSLLVLREIAAASRSSRGLRSIRLWTLLRSVALVAATLGLCATAVAQVPAPWTQWKRIRTSAPPPAPFALASPEAIVRASTKPGAAVAILAPLGHQIARDVGVKNVSPYSGAGDILSYEQIDEELDALREHHGTRFFLGEYTTIEVHTVLRAHGFRPAAGAGTSFTEWVYRGPSR
jgi:hypothetical protein